MANIREIAVLLLLLGSLPGCSAGDRSAAASAAAPAVAAATAARNAGNCLPQSRGYLHAQLRGALNTDLAWDDADMTCEGGSRPDGRGIRVSIAGPLAKDRRLRLLFGIDNSAANVTTPALPTNITAILEGEKQLFATLGDDKCTTERLQLVPLSSGAGHRVEVRGFCTGPASTLDGRDRLLVTTFDFSARVVMADTP